MSLLYWKQEKAENDVVRKKRAPVKSFAVILRWTDGSVVDYVNWWDGEPNNHDKSEQCAFMFTRTNANCKENILYTH